MPALSCTFLLIVSIVSELDTSNLKRFPVNVATNITYSFEPGSVDARSTSAPLEVPLAEPPAEPATLTAGVFLGDGRVI